MTRQLLPQKMLSRYTVVMRPDDNGTYVAYVPALEGCHAWGETAEEARTELEHVFEMIAEEYAETNRDLPPDVDIIAARAG